MGDKYYRCDTDTGVCTEGCEIGLDGDYCDRCDADAGICTDGCEIGLDETMVIYVMLTLVYVQTALK